jgi:anti-sigma B factor antagonist
MTAAIATPPAAVGPDPADLLWVGARPTGRRGRVVVDVVGEVDDYTAPLLAACLHGQSARSAVRRLVLDLSRVRFLSGAGVAVIEDAVRRCTARGARLELRTGGHEVLARALALAGLPADVPGADALRRRASGSPRRTAAPRRRRSRGPRNVARRSPPAGG